MKGKADTTKVHKLFILETEVAFTKIFGSSYRDPSLIVLVHCTVKMVNHSFVMHDRRFMRIKIVVGFRRSHKIRSAVMRSGQVVEEGPSARLLTAPQHAYTRKLLAAVPTLRTDRNKPLAMGGATSA